VIEPPAQEEKPLEELREEWGNKSTGSSEERPPEADPKEGAAAENPPLPAEGDQVPPVSAEANVEITKEEEEKVEEKKEEPPMNADDSYKDDLSSESSSSDGLDYDIP